MLIIGMDEAPKGIAWAYGEPDTIPKRGFHALNDWGDNDALLQEETEQWVVQFCKSIGAERIYWEQFFVRKVGLDLRILYRQFAVAYGIITASRILGLKHECYQVAVKQWRKQFYAGAYAAKGERGEESAAWKEMAIQECARRGWLIDEPHKDRPRRDQVAHDIAEACGVWDYGCKLSDPKYFAKSRIVTRRRQTKLDEEKRTS